MNAGSFSTTLDLFLRDRDPRGCTWNDIDKLAQRHLVRFPADYTTFLLKAGNGATGLWAGSDYTLNRLDGIQVGARELLAAIGLELPRDAFVFFMHQGYQFFYFCENGVYFYLEGASQVERRHSTFQEFFEATASVF